MCIKIIILFLGAITEFRSTFIVLPVGPPGSVPQLSSDTIQTVLSAAISAQDNITDEDTCPGDISCYVT